MLKRNKLDGILSGFTKIQKKLGAYISQVDKDVEAKGAEIVQLEATRGELRTEAVRANKVYDNLTKLLGE